MAASRSNIAETASPTGMACLRCSTTFPVHEYEAGCPRCAAERHASNLRLIYDRETGGVRLPYAQAASLGENLTPLVDLRGLADEIGVGRLSAKLEWCNPTGSHKDRMAAQLLAHASRLGFREIAAASSGNGGLAVAAYAALHGLKAEIATTRALPAHYRDAMTAHGATLACFDNSLERWAHVARRVTEGAFAATNYRVPAIGTNPFGIEGYKTLAAEIAAPGMPDVVVVPCARGDLLSGLHLGFAELGAIPRLVGAEPFPRLERVLAGADYRESFSGETDQFSIAGSTVTWQAFAALQASGGTAIAVPDATARDAQRRLAATGLHAEVSASSALAALRRLAQDGHLAGRHAVIVLTGSGRNDPDRYSRAETKASTGGSPPVR
ncbi:pyridoxal-phosphate dependent enzyme [Bosea sp. ANAM02]|uniref:pyridoxal-phosphate dependent enzyme n=1 Tax=Bosea sp. ANAM02 TaxID=2020412 RepID=UPI001566B44B|nr:pyridoxal-phosphate dependent enzyme [Bosea sp. ANAM02]